MLSIRSCRHRADEREGAQHVDQKSPHVTNEEGSGTARKGEETLRCLRER